MNNIKTMFAVICLLLLFSCTSSKEAMAQSFEWLSIYSPSARDKDMPDVDKLRHVDDYWELWGHNLHKKLAATLSAMPQKENTCYALVNGERTPDQLCFSSEQLYKATEAYILENFGNGNDKYYAHITIMPDDNKLVCQCKACKKEGNTETNATPAVTAFIERLAKRFPKHLFFGSSYLTTSIAPDHKLPSNVGIFLSSIDIPMRREFRATESFKRFEAKLHSWQKVCDRIYIWDYIKNFDDYLTPYPCLTLMKDRIGYFRENGIKGIFFNGSGDDYSSFDDIETYVILQLCLNKKADPKQLLEQAVKARYPETADYIIPYLESIEQEALSRDHALDFYGDLAAEEHSYLVPADFESFWTKLDRRSKSVKGEERKRLNTLLTALNFTRLQIFKQHGNVSKEDINEAIEVMKSYIESPTLRNYKEVNGSLEDYIKKYRVNS